MTLKFDVQPDGNGYILQTRIQDGTIRIQASDRELRRLLVDLVHTLDYEESIRIPEEPDS